MHIGIDLDNTLIDYDHVFARVGTRLGLLPEGMVGAKKTQVRDHLRVDERGERAWMALQGQVYGRFIEDAEFMAGAEQALRFLHDSGCAISIVSHKTEFGHFDPDQVDLRAAARSWLKKRLRGNGGGSAIELAGLHFLPTRRAKVARIRDIGCEIFVDDLAEVFCEAEFPANVRQILLCRGADVPAQRGAAEVFESWDKIVDHVFRPLFERRSG